MTHVDLAACSDFRVDVAEVLGPGGLTCAESAYQSANTFITMNMLLEHFAEMFLPFRTSVQFILSTAGCCALTVCAGLLTMHRGEHQG